MAPPTIARVPRVISTINVAVNPDGLMPVTSGPVMTKAPFAKATPMAAAARMIPPTTAIRPPTKSLVTVDFDIVFLLFRGAPRSLVGVRGRAELTPPGPGSFELALAQWAVLVTNDELLGLGGSGIAEPRQLLLDRPRRTARRPPDPCFEGGRPTVARGQPVQPGSKRRMGQVRRGRSISLVVQDALADPLGRKLEREHGRPGDDEIGRRHGIGRNLVGGVCADVGAQSLGDRLRNCRRVAPDRLVHHDRFHGATPFLYYAFDCSAFGMNTSRFQPPIPITRTTRTTSGQLVSQTQSPSIAGRNSTQTRTWTTSGKPRIACHA